MARGGDEVGRAYVALVLVQLFFATMAVAGKLALRDLPPLVLAAVRISAGAAALLVVAHVVARGTRLGRDDFGRFAVLGLFGVFLNQVLFIQGLSLTTAVNAVLLISTIPAFAYLFSVIRGEQRAVPLQVLGLGVSFAGVVLVVGTGRVGPETLLGDGLIVLNAASYAWYLVLSRPAVASFAPAVVVAWSFLFGALLTLVVAAPSLAALDWGAVPAQAWWVVGFIVLFPTIGSYSLNLYALRRLPPRTVAAFIYLQPVGGALLAVVVLGEVVGPGTLLGAALVLGGLALVLREARRPFGRVNVQV